MRTALIGHPGVTWRAWLKENRGSHDLLCLDPGDAVQTRPGQVTLLRGPKARAWRFYGSLDPNRAPHVLLAALASLLSEAGPDVMVQFPAYRGGPVARQTALLLAEVLRPDRILIGEGSELDPNGFPVGPELVSLDTGFPALVETAQRKARWLQFLAGTTAQAVPMARLSIEGARLGSGRALTRDQLAKSLPEAVHAEVTGSSLFVVTEGPFEDEVAARALNTFHCTRLVTALAGDYAGLVCSLARGANEDFAFGVVTSMDFAAGEVQLVSDAIPPAPATVLRLGSLRVDEKGNELGETKPWGL